MKYKTPCRFRPYAPLPLPREPKKKRVQKAPGPKDHKLYNTMIRGEASLALAIRTEKIGYNGFLMMRRVPGYTAEYQYYRYPTQNAKHMIM